MRSSVALNFGWRYCNHEIEGWQQPDFDDSAWDLVDIPHANKLMSRHYLDDQVCGFTCCYRLRTHVPSDWTGRFLLHFEAVASYAQVYVDGVLVGSHEGGYTPFDFELPPFVSPSDPFLLAVLVDASEQRDIPPFGGAIDYLTYGGIYRGVSLTCTDHMYLQDLCIQTPDLDSVSAFATVNGYSGTSASVRLALRSVLGEELCSFFGEMKGNGAVTVSCEFKQRELWTTRHPVLYVAVMELYREGELVDVLCTRFGFRSVEFRKDGFYLNGKRQKLRGLNRHQSYPYIGYAAPDSLQIADANLLKKVLCVDVVRTSHYPQAPAFLDRCDEIGLLVMTEIPGWQHVGTSDHWRQVCLQHVKEMVLRDRNHPCVISWGVRVNESADDHELYEQTNALARELDPTRPTSGIRNFAGSELLEDIYTYNDFVHRGSNHALDDPDKVSKQHDAPYLVTEHNGHMYPTRRTDSEAHRKEHALRHLRVLDAMYGQQRIAGAIGWCMADYNTHGDFGSGDQVCHHGVCDMYRIPKFAGWAYATQGDEVPAMVVSSTMDIGEHPAGYIGQVVVLTNCDSVDLYLDDKLVGTYLPDRKLFPNLPHPPVIIDDFIGNRLDEETRFSHKDRKAFKAILLKASEVGFDLPLRHKLSMLRLMMKYQMKMSDGVELFSKYIGGWGKKRKVWRYEGKLDGKVVCTSEFGSHTKPKLTVEVIHPDLHLGDMYDMAQLQVKAVLEGCDQPLPYANEALAVQVSGSVSLVGPSLVAMEGGACGIFVRTVGKTGPGRVSIHSVMGDMDVDFMVT